MFRTPCANHQKAKVVLYSLCYHHTETRELSKITKIQFYKYEQIVVKFMCVNFSGVITVYYLLQTCYVM